LIRLFAHVAAHVLRGEPLDNKVIAEGVASAQDVFGPAETVLARASAAVKLIQAAAAAKSASPSAGGAEMPNGETAPCLAPGCKLVAVLGTLHDKFPTYCLEHGNQKTHYLNEPLVRLRGHAGDPAEVYPSPELGVTA
jgi:hypothetical protein